MVDEHTAVSRISFNTVTPGELQVCLLRRAQEIHGKSERFWTLHAPPLEQASKRRELHHRSSARLDLLEEVTVDAPQSLEKLYARLLQEEVDLLHEAGVLQQELDALESSEGAAALHVRFSAGVVERLQQEAEASELVAAQQSRSPGGEAVPVEEADPLRQEWFAQSEVESSAGGTAQESLDSAEQAAVVRKGSVFTLPALRLASAHRLPKMLGYRTSW